MPHLSVKYLATISFRPLFTDYYFYHSHSITSEFRVNLLIAELSKYDTLKGHAQVYNHKKIGDFILAY